MNTNRSRSWRTLGLDFVTLRVYAAAIEERSLAAAAERENIALSAVSRRISDLECRSGITLLNRHDRGVTPTSAGEALFSRLGDAFAIFEQIASELDAMRSGTLGRVRIQAHMSAASLLLPERLAAFKTENPTVDIEVEEVTSVEIVHSVQMGRTDIGFVSATTVPSSLCCSQWHQDELMVALPEAHPLARESTLRFDSLLEYPFISMQKGSALHKIFQHAAEERGRQLNVIAHSSSFESARRMVAAGLGLSILPQLALQGPASQNVEARKIDEPWALRSLLMIHRPVDQLPASARSLVSYLAASRNVTLSADAKEIRFAKKEQSCIAQ
ncbi:LysR family transcriptional regulator [Burkholderia sp. IMCC1007]|uniref:LysR family transcriptional regulator n=1 Tax=Burkholderia sp. IMCC1007 TaxID=3004104 RepID=UPI0022B3853F|nr:LysR family transcriptional regulator [Burkholderia sp. IMCC1007]